MQKWETVYHARHGVEANLLKGHLGQHGIEARSDGEELIGAYAGVPKAAAVRVKVPANLAQKARDILDAFAAKPEGTPWACAECSEENGAAFELCWQCSSPRPDAP